MNNVKTFKCKRVSVDCMPNDIESINNGGPKYIGFDFFVKEDEKADMKEFIADVLGKFGIPCMAIYEGENLALSLDHIWTKDDIVATIENSLPDFIESEVQRSRSM